VDLSNQCATSSRYSFNTMQSLQKHVIISCVSRGELTLWLHDVQKRLWPRGGGRSQGPDPALRDVDHSLQQGHVVFGAAVGAGNHLARRTDQRQVAHSGNNILGKKQQPLTSLKRYQINKWNLVQCKAFSVRSLRFPIRIDSLERLIEPLIRLQDMPRVCTARHFGSGCSSPAGLH